MFSATDPFQILKAPRKSVVEQQENKVNRFLDLRFLPYRCNMDFEVSLLISTGMKESNGVAKI